MIPLVNALNVISKDGNLFLKKTNWSGVQIMQPPLNREELAELYPHLHPDERSALEVWHRDWITKMFMGQATQEEYDAAISPYPDPHHPEIEDEQK